MEVNLKEIQPQKIKMTLGGAGEAMARAALFKHFFKLNF